METNKLYCGDNLEIMQGMPDGCIDLICTDPPFNTGKDWGEFDDRWEGGLEGYLKFMKPRCEQMHRLLKDTGSLYLHCDTSASHYLKVMLDTIFGIKQFRNEIVWMRQHAQPNSTKTKYPCNHDCILFYAKTDNNVFNKMYNPLTEKSVKEFRHKDEKGIYYITHGKKYYLKDVKGSPIATMWVDRGAEWHFQGWSSERVGYPTQKPVALYARMIEASSNQGDVVLDAFCGSGTTLVAANELGRYWIGIDKNETAINIAQDRLKQLNLFTSPNDEVRNKGE